VRRRKAVLELRLERMLGNGNGARVFVKVDR
jgi:hypothetical protein